MKLIKEIYHLKPYHTHISEENGDIGIVLKYKNRYYNGCALLAPEDEGFFSSKVGMTIALSRARQMILKDLIEDLQIRIKERELFIKEASGYGLKDADSNGCFLSTLRRNQNNLHRLKVQLEKEQRFLNDYLQGQDKAIATVKRMRKGQK